MKRKPVFLVAWIAFVLFGVGFALYSPTLGDDQGTTDLLITRNGEDLRLELNDRSNRNGIYLEETRALNCGSDNVIVFPEATKGHAEFDEISIDAALLCAVGQKGFDQMLDIFAN